VPLDEQEAAGISNCRSTDEIEALRYVLDRYFVRMDDGHYNKRMAEEVAKAERLSRQLHEAGLRSAEARRERARAGAQAKAEARLNLGSTKAEPRSVTPSPSPSLTPTPSSPPTPEGQKQNTSALTAPSDVDPQVWADWKALRKAKKAAVTATAVAGIRKQAKAAGMTLEAALGLCCERGWAGFKAEWVAAPRAAGGSIEDRNRAAAEAMKRMLDDQERTING
jgi:uncharacterized protein YdaU (DUF1376 family)